MVDVDPEWLFGGLRIGVIAPDKGADAESRHAAEKGTPAAAGASVDVSVVTLEL